MSKDIASRNKLSVEESARFAELKFLIAEHFAGFWVTGMALAEISDKRLYRENYSTFEEFCQEEYNKSASEIYRLIRGAEVVKALPENVTKFVTSASQAEELSKVEPEKRPKVIKAAASKGKVTAKSIRQAAAEAAEPARVVAHTEVMPSPSPARVTDNAPAPSPFPTAAAGAASLDSQWKAALGGRVPAIPQQREYVPLYGERCKGCLLDAIQNASVKQLESLLAFWRTDCADMVHDRIKQLKREAKKGSKK